ncbi:hypothetical protein JGU66_29210 [Myxococcaceae bacterium JPH2]|nr:hypothetical protein [Myxococcaceae bacterium JPH2]
MKRAWLSIVGAGLLLAGLAQASTTSVPAAEHTGEASSLAVCISPKPSAAPAQEQALACRQYPCLTCEKMFDSCDAACTTTACHNNCAASYRQCTSCCTSTVP